MCYLSGRLQMVSQYQQQNITSQESSCQSPSRFCRNVPSQSCMQITHLCSASDCHSFNSILKDSLDIAKDWFKANYLFFNQNKTENIFFSLHTHLHDDLDESLFKYVKLLGMYLDSKLCWGAHTKNLSKKLSKGNLENCESQDLNDYILWPFSWVFMLWFPYLGQCKCCKKSVSLVKKRQSD